MIVELADLKEHLRVDHDDEDASIRSFGLAAEEAVRTWIGRSIYPVGTVMPAPDAPDYDPHQMIADEAVSVAIKMIALRLYSIDRNGGDAAFDPSVPPLAVRALLSGHRVWT